MIYVLAFLLGSIPTAFWYGKFFHNIDIRNQGSGNVGATNSLRVMGKKAGIIVLCIDLLKGLIPVFLARYFGFTPENIFLVGLLAVMGHLFSPFVGFKGGKGIATSFGVILGISPLSALICFAVFALLVYLTRFVSLGSLVGVLTFWLISVMNHWQNTWVMFYVSLLTALLIFAHRNNISRLRKGEENKI